MIYPINDSIEKLMSDFTDEETGELTCSEEEMAAAIENLQMEFDLTIMALRNAYLNTELDFETVAAEAKVLRDKAASVQKRRTACRKKRIV